jgi:hypothetical protein
MILPSSTTLHLDVSARGDYDTGVFAYNFIRRGERYGLRIVGSLKSKPALNVLAAYEVQPRVARTSADSSHPPPRHGTERAKTRLIALIPIRPARWPPGRRSG